MGLRPRRPTSDAARWVATTAVVGAVVGALMVLLGMDPRLAIVACVVALVSAASWLLMGIAPVSEPLTWYDHSNAAWSSARADRRVQQLTSRLRHSARNGRRRRGLPTRTGPDVSEPVDEIVTSLVAVIDDQLRAQHHIERSDDHDAAARVLGPELTRFVDDPATARKMTQRRTLAHTVALIEEFTSPTLPPTTNPKDDR